MKHRTCTCAQKATSLPGSSSSSSRSVRLRKGNQKKKKVGQLSGRSVPTVRRLGVIRRCRADRRRQQRLERRGRVSYGGGKREKENEAAAVFLLFVFKVCSSRRLAVDTPTPSLTLAPCSAVKLHRCGSVRTTLNSGQVNSSEGC